MLRITRTTSKCGMHLKLEGKLLSAWVNEVLEQIGGADGLHTQLNLDLSQVSFVDAAGEALLRGLLLRGAMLSNCSSYITELLNVEKP